MSPEPPAQQYRRSLLAASLVSVISVPLLFAVAMGLVDYGINGRAGGESFSRALGAIVLVLGGTFGVFGTWSVLPLLMGAVTSAAGGSIFCLAAGIRFGSTAI